MTHPDRRTIRLNPGHTAELASLVSRPLPELTPENLSELLLQTEPVDLDKVLYVLREEVATIATLVLNLELLLWDLEEIVPRLSDDTVEAAEELLTLYENHVERGQHDSVLIMRCVRLLLDKLDLEANPFSALAQEHIATMIRDARKTESALENIDIYNSRYLVARNAVAAWQKKL